MCDSRRRFLVAGGVALADRMMRPGAVLGQRPAVSDPRATDGDDRHQPPWEEQLTITVGNTQGDLIGTDDRVLQAAVDYVNRMGGGTVKVNPGTYTLRGGVELPSNIRIVGSGSDSVITRIPSQVVSLAADSDWYDQEITLSQPADFRLGDGVVIQVNNPDTGETKVIKRTIVARTGNRLKLNDGLRENVWLSGEPTCSSLFPLFTSQRTTHVTIENLTLDGNRANTANLNGNYGGCIFLQDCNHYTIRDVETRNYNGDGISFQICHDVVVENCHSHGNADLGVHPGSGSQRPVIRDCRLEGNGLGLFWCWGVKYGLAEGNRIVGNRDYGISIGHNDTDNVMRNNQIIDSGKVGILFRDDARGKDFWANRNTIEHNRIQNSGGPQGIAIDVQGNTKDLLIANNEISESRQPEQRIGIRISDSAQRIELNGNRFSGLSRNVVRQSALSS